MLFMGSAKYPSENAYDAFLSAHGGYSNAMTECEYTVYHYEVPPVHAAQVRMDGAVRDREGGDGACGNGRGRIEGG